MTDQQIIDLLEEALEVEQGTLTPETRLEHVVEYDSMAKLSVIVLMDEEFGLTLSGERMQNFITVQDIIDFSKE